ncbi:MAG TPA: phosphoribosylglycinamide formyltransferase [Chitinispirillaceae bacterium]|nr:phosphoribosylglycinamide formyltransferase [Chitinispirillaceae bacterium]
MVRCAVFASGGGSNFQALIDHKNCGDLHVEFALLISNNSKSFACERARQNDIPAIHLSEKQFESPDAYSEQLMGLLDEYKVDLIVLAGYMKKLPDVLVQKYRMKILNIHPGLLPAFGGKGMYGKHVHQAVLDYGAKISGVTVHFVNEEYDQGPVILQQAIPVFDTDDVDSLAARVLTLEHAHFWRALEAVACGKVRVQGRRVTGEI